MNKTHVAEYGVYDLMLLLGCDYPGALAIMDDSLTLYEMKGNKPDSRYSIPVEFFKEECIPKIIREYKFGKLFTEINPVSVYLAGLGFEELGDVIDLDHLDELGDIDILAALDSLDEVE